MIYRMCALKKFENIRKSNFGIFIKHKNNLGYERARLVEYDTCHQCPYEDRCAFDDATVYNKICFYDDVFVYDNVLIYGCLGWNKNLHVYQRGALYWHLNRSGEVYIYTNAVIFSQVMNAQYIEVCSDTCDYREARVYRNALICCDVKICGKVKFCRRAVLCVIKFFCNHQKNFTYSPIPHCVKEEDRSGLREAYIGFITLFILFKVPYFVYFISINMSQIIDESVCG
ncbi:hypothetical protein [Bartonella massiliensis]|uniref:hypothetical protein n=1 Tax=Bartonella massiliensis TaxID=929795 RepID=UPI001158BCBC|nr:hypothetical protein [Bartonella massiliensis]